MDGLASMVISVSNSVATRQRRSNRRFKEIELIYIDDGFIDNSLEIAQHHSISVLAEINQWGSAAWGSSTGQFVIGFFGRSA